MSMRYNNGKIHIALLLTLLVAFAIGLAGCVEDTDTAGVTETQTEATEMDEPETETPEADSIYDPVPGEVGDWDVPANPEQYLVPSEEELQQIMMQDAQEAMAQDYYDYGEGYFDYDSSLGKRGR